jgi:formate-dependent phosphoribosylglycinamide formyltransferase (GAR transformylase)
VPTVLFVAPFYLDTTLRFVRAVADLPDVRLGVISQEPAERLPDELRRRLAGHQRVADGLDPEQIAAAARALAAELGPPERLLGVLEQLQVPLAEAREAMAAAGMPMPGLSVEAAHNFRDKSRMKTVLAAAGLPCARHRLAADAGVARAFADEVGYPLVAKPPAGAGAKSTFRLDGSGDLEQALALFSPTAERPLLLEEFVTGREHSFDSVVVDGRPVWHSITHYLPSPLEVVGTPWIQWCVLLPREVDHPRYDAIRDVGFRAVATLGLDTGLSHLEWFRLADGRVAVSEVGARPPGAQITTLMSWAHDADLYRAWARLMVFATFDPPARRYAAGAAYLRAQGSGTRIVAVHGLDRAQAELGSLVVETKLPRPGQPPSGSYEGEGYVILRHPETEVVERGLHRLVSLVRVELG